MRRLLRFLPVPFWCYFLPMIAGSLGWIPRESGFYTFVSRQILPVCLVLLLIGTDLKALGRIGGKATALMLAHPSVIKRPVVVWNDGQISVGFDAPMFAKRTEISTK